jgi:N-acetylmuramoyl-L-alanine amidase
MIIDDKKYVLTTKNYIPIETSKKLIVFGNTFNTDMRHFDGWLHRYNGVYKKTAPFTVTRDGVVHEHFNPKFYSKYFEKHEMNLDSIVILFENEGYLRKNEQNNEFITWLGDIYKQPDEVVDRKWRNEFYWASYTEEQINSAVYLVSYLCQEFGIPFTCVNHNTKIDNYNGYSGIIYKSNLEKHYTDLSPSWDFELFKNKLEQHEREH